MLLAALPVPRLIPGCLLWMAAVQGPQEHLGVAPQSRAALSFFCFIFQLRSQHVFVVNLPEAGPEFLISLHSSGCIPTIGQQELQLQT